MLWVFGKQSALKLGIAKLAESKSQVSLSMTSCLQVSSWWNVTWKFTFGLSWHEEYCLKVGESDSWHPMLVLHTEISCHVLQLYMHHVQWSVAMMHYFSCDFSLWPICAFPTTTNTHTFMLPTFTGLAILWVTENICINVLQQSIRVFDACDVLQYCWKQKSKNLRFQLQLSFEKNCCPNVQVFWILGLFSLIL